MPGKEISTYQDLCINILENINNSHSYLKEFNKNISELSSKYIEDENSLRVKNFYNFIIILKSYESFNNMDL